MSLIVDLIVWMLVSMIPDPPETPKTRASQDWIVVDGILSPPQDDPVHDSSDPFLNGAHDGGPEW